MKKIAFSLFATLSLFTSSIHANRSYSIRELQPHRFYFGPEAVWMHLDTNVKNIHVFGNKWLGGLRLGYEYVRPHAFYAGIDLVSCIGSNFDAENEQGQSVLIHTGRVGFEDIELRLGYTLASKRFVLIPFLGIGSYNLGRIYYDGYNMTLLYAAGGFKANYDFTPVFNAGITAKAFFGSAEKEFRFIDKKTVEANYNDWGGEISVPLDWRIGPSRSWDIQLEPFALKLISKENQYGFGSRLLFGYHF